MLPNPQTQVGSLTETAAKVLVSLVVMFHLETKRVKAQLFLECVYDLTTKIPEVLHPLK